jgi:hypothetical protein
MQIMTKFRSATLWLLIFPALLIVQSCKKSSGGGDDAGNTSGYYLTANIGGKDWSANVKSSLQNSPSIAAITTANGAKIVLLIGVKAVNKDTTAIALIFPQNIQLNKAATFDANKYLEGAYIAEMSAGSGTYYGYNTTPATGGSGTITVTTFDQTNSVIEGTFSGNFGSQNGKAALPVTNGKFRCIYTTDNTKLPVPGSKF